MDSEFESVLQEFSALARERERTLTLARAAGEPPPGPATSIALKDLPKPPQVERPATDELSRLIAGVEERAALSGAFLPEDVLSATLNAQQRVRMLTVLSSECFVAPVGTTMRWFMLNEPRAAALRRLHTRNRLHSALLEPLPPTDDFGRALRELLALGSEVSLERGLADLLTLSRAVDVLALAGLPLPDRDALRVAIGRASFLAEFDTLGGEGFFGREAELHRLRKFVSGAPVRSTPGYLDWRGVVVTGPGGAGKSTLLVRLLKEVISTRAAVVAVLDFDRPGIDLNDTEWLEFEISRQVGYQRAELDAPLESSRRQLRAARERFGAQPLFSAERASAQRASRRILLTLRELLESKAPNVPFLLVLDTFEHVIARELLGAANQWLSDVAQVLGPVALKVVLAGRLFDRGREQVITGMADVVEVADLEKHDAQQLLRSLEIPEPHAARIAASDLVPRRPLELRLLARLIRLQPAIDMDRIEQELREGGPAAAEMFGGIVYRRVLQRIENERTRQLAYPGLILRFVTPAILRHVLVPALGLQPLSEEEAEQILAELASHQWLVLRDASGAVWHRRDLRRSTLRAMIARDEQRAADIHRRAIAYFDGQASEALQAEAVYHRLMLVKTPQDAASIAPEAIRSYSPGIDADASDWPPVAQTLVDFSMGRFVAVEHLPRLPLSLRAEAYHATGLRFVEGREFIRAWNLILGRRPLLEQTMADPANWSVSRDWEIETTFATGHWSYLLSCLDDPVGPRAASRALVLCYRELLRGKDRSPRSRSKSVEREHTARTLREFAGALEARFTASDLSLWAMALVLMHGRGAITRDHLRELAGAIEGTAGARSAPTLQRRWYLVSRIANADSVATLTLTPQFTCLRRDWLAGWAAPRAPDSTVGAVPRFMEAIGTILSSGPRRDARSLLAQLDSVDAGKANLYLWARSSHSFLMRFMAGPVPEFRDPARYALLKAFADWHDHALLAGLIRDQLDVEIEGLRDGSFEREMGVDAERALEPYIELVDRSWRLRQLLEEAMTLAPDDPEFWALRDVRDAMLRWERAVQIALATDFDAPSDAGA